MKNSVLPIGSIITADKVDFMICGYFNKDVKYEGEPYDYVCCLYPAGVGSKAAFIRKEQIEKVKLDYYL